MIFHFLIAYILSADLINYDGKTATFSKHFQIEHPLGTLSGEKAILMNLCLPPNKTAQKDSIQIQLENQILLDACNAPIPLSISSQRAHCALPSKNIFPTLQTQEIEFYENVVIKGPLDIIAKGGSAIYSQNKLTLYPSASKSHCQIKQNENWIQAEKILFDLLQMELICLSSKGYIAEKALFFSADSLKLSLSKNFHPQLVMLEGKVALHGLYQNKKSFCLAEAASYKIDEKEWLLTAEPEKKVLFWQDGLELSAPKLRITDTIEGIGDIRFILNTEQKHQLLQIFSRYL